MDSFFSQDLYYDFYEIPKTPPKDSEMTDHLKRIAELEAQVEKLSLENEKYKLFFQDLNKKYHECTEGLNFSEEDLLQAQALLSLGTLGMIDAEMIALSLAAARLRQLDE